MKEKNDKIKMDAEALREIPIYALRPIIRLVCSKLTDETRYFPHIEITAGKFKYYLLKEMEIEEGLEQKMRIAFDCLDKIAMADIILEFPSGVIMRGPLFTAYAEWNKDYALKSLYIKSFDGIFTANNKKTVTAIMESMLQKLEQEDERAVVYIPIESENV